MPISRLTDPLGANPNEYVIAAGSPRSSRGNSSAVVLKVLGVCVCISGLAVAQTPTTTSLVSSPNPAHLGEAVTLTATVTAGATGKITFYEDTTMLGVSPVSGVQATLTTVLLPVGLRSLRAYYGGDAGHLPSSSPVVAQTVNALPSLGLRPAVNYAIGLNSVDGLVGDFNGDNRQDLAVANLNGGNISVLIGNGNGTFQPSISYTVPGTPRALTTGDFNGDSKSDLAVISNGGLSLYLGNGDGTFQPATTFATDSNVRAMASGDFNGDGKADLALGALGAMNILLGNGDGTFQAAVSYEAVPNAAVLTIVVRDFNGDGNADLAAGTSTPSCVSVLLGNGDGTFHTPVNYPFGSQVNGLSVSDLNGDGKLDVVATDANFSAWAILLGNGDGTFQAAVRLIVPPARAIPSPNSISVGDVNGDGKPDLIAISSSSSFAGVQFGNGDGTFQLPVTVIIPSKANVAIVGDFDGDGRTDLAVPGNANVNAQLSVLLGGAIPDFAIAIKPGTSLTQGQVGAVYTVTVSNAGDIASSVGVTVVDSLPAGLTATAISGSGWTCVLATVSCTNSIVGPAGASFPPIKLTVNVANGLSGNVTNTATASVVGDSNPGNNTATDTTTVGAIPLPDLTVALEHFGSFVQGQKINADYRIKVTNIGSSGTTGIVTITDTLPAGLIPTALSGPGWNCIAPTGPCTRSDLLAAGSSYPIISLTVNVTVDAPALITPTAMVSGGGEANVTNDSASDPTTVIAVTPNGSRFIPITPCRVVDTRNSLGPFGGPPLARQTARDFLIPNGACGIPANASAYSFNAAVVPKSTLGFLTVWPTGQTQPLVATLNSDGRIKSNAAIVPAGTNGGVSVFATDATEVILDINGYFVPASDASALAFYPLTPCRIADTRNAIGPLGGPRLVAQGTRSFPITASSCGVPAIAQAYSLNFAAVTEQPLGYLTAWPAGQAQPLAASLNDPAGTVAANAVIVPAGAGGAVNVFSTDTADLVIDINGYFAPPGTGGLSFYGVPPCRVLDSRLPVPTPPFATTIDVNVTASPCGLPSTAQAYVFNSTVVPPGPLGYITLWPQGQSQPLAATLNAYDGAVTNNMAIVPTTSGSISVYPSNPTHLVLDVAGYFAP